MATPKLTQEILDKREAHVKEVLSRKPEITKSHFKTAFGYSMPWLNTLEDTGVKFGKRTLNQIKL